MRESRRAPRFVRAAAAAAACILAALGIAYSLTYEPAPRIGILWQGGITPERRAAHERRFLLVNPARSNELTMYDLLDTRRENIEALVNDPDVADTESVRSADFSLPADGSYGESWMWIRHRLPVLRRAGVVEAIVLGCAAVLAAAIRVEVRNRRRRPGPP